MIKKLGLLGLFLAALLSVQPLRSPDGMAVWMSTWNAPITTIGGIITATLTDGGTGTHTAGRVEYSI